LVLGVLPSLYVALLWLGAIEERWVRLERPLAAFPAALAGVFACVRLRRLSPRQSPWRRALTELLLASAALAAAWATIGIELGRPLDRLAVLVAIDRSRSIELVPNAATR